MRRLTSAVAVVLLADPVSGQDRIAPVEMIQGLSERGHRMLRSLQAENKLSMSEARRARELYLIAYDELGGITRALTTVRATRLEVLNQNMVVFYRHVEDPSARRRREALRQVLLKELPAHLLAAERLWREGVKNWGLDIPPGRKNRKVFPHLFTDEKGDLSEFDSPVLDRVDLAQFVRYAQHLREEWAWMHTMQREIAAAQDDVKRSWTR